jgi:hypothetical protein
VNLSLSLTSNLSLSGGAASLEAPETISGLQAWYDPSDLSTMWKDTAGTDPVTADGDAVARIDDKSGNARHLTQGTAANRPLYKTAGGLHWLQFDGTNDQLSVNSAGLRITGDLTLCAGVYKNAGGTFGGILSCQTGAATVNAYEWRLSNHGTLAVMEFIAGDGAAVESDAVGTVTGTLAAAHVLSVRRDGGATIDFSLDGADEIQQAHTKVPTADASSVFVMGNRNATGIPLAGRIYAATVYDALLSAGDLGTLETYVGGKCGVVV